MNDYAGPYVDKAQYSNLRPDAAGPSTLGNQIRNHGLSYLQERLVGENNYVSEISNRLENILYKLIGPQPEPSQAVGPGPAVSKDPSQLEILHLLTNELNGKHQRLAALISRLEESL